ncbi:MAG: cysteine--tRNA ligase [Desulfobacteraceae bacterium 4572_123]|nr:MAG: cysteine--tRNA ligase [Desulfobacteraceae bacterium 4572_123]
MTIRIYNTLKKKKQVFETIEPGKVRMYVCGPTVYDSCHIGHARSVVVFDVIMRYLEASGYAVTYVRNFTDVDDKIIKRANEMKVDCREIAEKYIAEFYTDMDRLNVRRATIEPRATEHISDIIRIIEILMNKKTAYRVEDDVYFAVEKFNEYGRLSGRRLEDMEAGARVDVDERKHNPFDFALWKGAKPGEPSWDSPWGRGRPGWHIECSAMSSALLGETIDIHGGGKDLIFPHHENEIAQSEAAFAKPFVKYWIHNGFVNIDHEKMSKSLGNFMMIKEIINTCHPEALRLFLLSNHYRSPIDYTPQNIEEAGKSLDKFYGALQRINETIGNNPENVADNSFEGEYWKKFCSAMDDDFNTALGLGSVFDAIRNINRMLDETPGNVSDDTREQALSARAQILKIGTILGILAENPDDYFRGQKKSAIEKQDLDPGMIEDLIKARSEARALKNWARADEIRKKLEEMNVVVEDRADGTFWKIEVL